MEMKRSLYLMVLVMVVLGLSGCVNWHSPMIYDASANTGRSTVKNDEVVYIVFGTKARVDMGVKYLDNRGLETMKKYTVDEERDAGNDVGIWIFKIKSGDKTFIPLSDEVLQSGRICDEQIRKIEAFIKNAPAEK